MFVISLSLPSHHCRYGSHNDDKGSKCTLALLFLSLSLFPLILNPGDAGSCGRERTLVLLWSSDVFFYYVLKAIAMWIEWNGNRMMVVKRSSRLK